VLSVLATCLAFLKRLRRGNLGDTLFRILTLIFGLFLLVIVIGIVYES
jgi:uncharacterized membrane protein